MRRVELVLFVLLLTGSTAVVQPNEEIKTILEQFCLEYYDNFFYPRQYVVGTLVVTSVDVDKANKKIRVKGTHTCRGKHIPFIGRRTYAGREFKAELMLVGNDVKVRFWRWNKSDIPGRDGYWEGPCEAIITPKTKM